MPMVRTRKKKQNNNKVNQNKRGLKENSQGNNFTNNGKWRCFY